MVHYTIYNAILTVQGCVEMSKLKYIMSVTKKNMKVWSLLCVVPGCSPTQSPVHLLDKGLQENAARSWCREAAVAEL